jgi:hypothetical protein
MTLWSLLCSILFINLASKTVMIIMKLIEIVVVYCLQGTKCTFLTNWVKH